MASSATASTLLETLPARPPTPPRETLRQTTDVSLKSLLGRPSPHGSRLSLHTPPAAHTPSSAASDDSRASSARMNKKVGWSNHTEYKEPPNYQHQQVNGQVKITPSSAAKRPAKGILKPSPSPNPLASPLGNQLYGLTTEVSVTDMLDSAIKQLASSDRDSRLDAYSMLARGLKASNNLPDRVALQDKMSLFTQFIQRDVTAKNATGSFDSSLCSQALNLLATFLHFQAIASTITPDFALFIVDHAIRSFEDTSVSKEVVRQLMQVMAFQNFSPKVMSSDRVARLVASLHNIESHVKGKSIVMSRIQIYKRLVKQSSSHMANHTEWLKDLLTDMLSSIKDIQAQAVQLGLEAGYQLRSLSHVLRKVSEILQATNEDQKYMEFYIQKLRDMVKDKSRSYAVPQVWSAVTMFLRCPLDRWEYYAPWTQLIQSCFNTSDAATKHEANYAWNRYVFLCLNDGKLSPKLLSVLCQPLFAQLRRKSVPKQVEESQRFRRTVLGGIHTLFYYAFRPGMEKFPPELVWDISVQPIIAQLIGSDGAREASPDGVMQASRILVALLDVKTPVVWREDRILDAPPVRADELPSIESKWIRKHSERVFKSVGPVLEAKFLDLANKDSLTYRLWEALVGSVAVASAKDIKVNEETAKFFALTFGLLAKVWSKGCSDNASLVDTKLLPAVHHFVKTMVDALGLLPFLEKRLSMTVPNTFEPVATPSQRPDKDRGTVRSPMHHLFTMLSSLPQGGSDNDVFSNFFLSTFELFFTGKSVKGRLDLSRELLRLLPSNTLLPSAPWNFGAAAVRASLESNAQPASSVDRLQGPEYREITSFMERGLTSHPDLSLKQWLALFDILSDRVGEIYGDAGRALAVIEPLAKAMFENVQPNSQPSAIRKLQVIQRLFEVAKLPRDRQALEAARRRLWGAPTITSKGTSADPFDYLYKLGNESLRVYYAMLGEVSEEPVPLIGAVGSFMSGSFDQSGFTAIAELQDGLLVWLQDGSERINPNGSSTLSASLLPFWTEICAKLIKSGQPHRSQVDLIEPLLAAAFKSKHEAIVNKAIEVWNAFAKDDEVACSDSLRSIVSSVQPKPEQVPPATETPEGNFGAQATAFSAPQDDTSFIALSSFASVDQPEVSSVILESQEPARSTRSKKRKSGPNTDVAHAKPVKRASRTSTPRSRHDNSQIKFEPVMPSSSPVPNESQHLTERQLEVRERQKENAALFREVQPSSPGLAHTSPEKPATELHNRAQEGTPVRANSYNELISSTPTPRRGQIIMDEYNDPPSSPPDPRPCLLISEIRSRSRASGSMENWDFSSPAGSPVSSRQQVAEVAEPPRVAMTDDSTQAKEKVPEVSATVEKITTRGESKASQRRNARRNMLVTPSPRQTRRRTREKLESSPLNVVPEPVLPTASKDTSFAFSEGDESHMIRMITEVESGQRAEPDQPASTKKDENSVPKRKTRASAALGAGDVIPSTPAEELSDASQLNQRKKRKRGNNKSHESRRKRRRSTESTEPSQIADSQMPGVDDIPSSAPVLLHESTPTGVRTRRSARKEQESREAEEVRVKMEAVEAEKEEGGDTDEELLSQLINDSQAASQSQIEEQVSVPPSMPQDSVVIESTGYQSSDNSESVNEPDNEMAIDVEREVVEKQAPSGSIMDVLKGGLQTLRSAALTRDEVYKIEDMLMDMKRELYKAERRGRSA